ncbi:hypothetical protein HPP92_007549 [Vanilla planifolia]|uniref:Uncharacterized protein n=1 Tax=Vanilla planifolia TaxID=51239 RepID=A0A835REC0_VANPL|nr:hypothetical protein HPP92_007549 [Vanilla planifolia]
MHSPHGHLPQQSTRNETLTTTTEHDEDGKSLSREKPTMQMNLEQMTPPYVQSLPQPDPNIGRECPAAIQLDTADGQRPLFQENIDNVRHFPLFQENIDNIRHSPVLQKCDEQIKELEPSRKKRRIKWNDKPFLQRKFILAVEQLGIDIIIATNASEAVALLSQRAGEHAINLAMVDFKLLRIVALGFILPAAAMIHDEETTVELVSMAIQSDACECLSSPIRLEEIKILWQHIMIRRYNLVKSYQKMPVMHMNLDQVQLPPVILPVRMLDANNKRESTTVFPFMSDESFRRLFAMSHEKC